MVFSFAMLSVFCLNARLFISYISKTFFIENWTETKHTKKEKNNTFTFLTAVFYWFAPSTNYKNIWLQYCIITDVFNTQEKPYTDNAVPQSQSCHICIFIISHVGIIDKLCLLKSLAILCFSACIPRLSAWHRPQPSAGQADQPQVGREGRVHQSDSEPGAGHLHPRRPRQSPLRTPLWLPGGGI